MTFDEMEENRESIKIGLETLLLKHDDISKNVSICNTALSNNDNSKSSFVKLPNDSSYPLDFLIVSSISDFVPSTQPNFRTKKFNDFNRSDSSFDEKWRGAELFYEVITGLAGIPVLRTGELKN
ncbi:hypothetical protein TNCV_4723861 [Trichonephila clavipes]|uniref:Uncharacterized protein n=1 Tax=Trichonephila clavipes TaxID=2585209 RepID=A0A8X6W6L1_TRICX|nr:hypothetical protein TNCV_4723861 [Trichonephila clavipes]